MNAERILRQHLEDQQRAGVTHAPSGVATLVTEFLAQRAELRAENQSSAAVTKEQRAIPRLGKKAAAPAKKKTATSPKAPASVASSIAEPAVAPNSAATTASISPVSEDRIAQLATVADRVAACQKCQELANSRTQTVFGVGNPDAELMFIGEAPGAAEDRQGEPFVGESGRLLDKIIVASQMTREEIYICNILRCRPPGNRNPSPIEADNCREYLDAQIELVKPKYIVCWGSVAAQNLLASKTSIGRMRGKFFDYKGIKVACTYHPSYLLRNPSAKKMVWEDIKFVRAAMGVALD
jgi:DNA polymerase